MQKHETTTEQSIEQLFIKAYGEIRSRLLNDKWIIPVTALAVEKALSSLSIHIDRYSGPVAEDEFVGWCVEQATQASRIETLYQRFNKTVLAGVWSVLKGNLDLGADDQTARDLAAETWTDFILKDKLGQLTHASGLSSWFYALGRNTARAWRTGQLRHRDRHPASLEDVALRRSQDIDGRIRDEHDYRRSKADRESSWDEEPPTPEPLAAD